MEGREKAAGGYERGDTTIAEKTGEEEGGGGTGLKVAFFFFLLRGGECISGARVVRVKGFGQQQRWTTRFYWSDVMRMSRTGVNEKRRQPAI